MENLPYNNTDSKSIENYAKGMIGKTFQDIYDAYCDNNRNLINSYSDMKRKGGLGNLIEECYFYYKQNSDSSADFPEAGVELKVTPYEINKNKQLRAGERLILTMISYQEEIEPDFFKSHVWQKCKLILLVYYLRSKEIKNNMLYPIRYVQLFTPPEKDLVIIKHDYRKIVEKIRAGLAHELSEGDTLYLGACTKGSTAAASIVSQFYNPSVKAKKRAFCYKNSYMTFVLNEYIVPHSVDKQKVEAVFNDKEIQNNTFEDIITGKINRYIGKSDIELSDILDYHNQKNKSRWSILVYRMLGIKGNQAEEFIKANIKVKVIRVENNGKIKEDMSFPTFKYKEIIKGTWEESDLYNTFETEKYLFVIFKSDGTNYRLYGCRFWNMPSSDLNGEVKRCWEETVDTINRGVELTITGEQGKEIVHNNLPAKTDHPVVHVRPHASQRYYKLEDGRQIGNGSPGNSNELPDGRWMPNHCFFLNKEYILEQLKSEQK